MLEKPRVPEFNGLMKAILSKQYKLWKLFFCMIIPNHNVIGSMNYGNYYHYHTLYCFTIIILNKIFQNASAKII